MNKVELIKDSVIFGNMILIMRLATNKVVANTSDIVADTEGEVDTGSSFHASTLQSRLSLADVDSTSEPEQGEDNDQ